MALTIQAANEASEQIEYRSERKDGMPGERSSRSALRPPANRNQPESASHQDGANNRRKRNRLVLRFRRLNRPHLQHLLVRSVRYALIGQADRSYHD